MLRVKGIRKKGILLCCLLSMFLCAACKPPSFLARQASPSKAWQPERWSRFLASATVPGKDILYMGTLRYGEGESARRGDIAIWGSGEKSVKIVLRDGEGRLVASIYENGGRADCRLPDGSRIRRDACEIQGSLAPVTMTDLFRFLQGDYAGPFLRWEEPEQGPHGGFLAEIRNGTKAELFLDETGRPVRLLAGLREMTFMYGEEGMPVVVTLKEQGRETLALNLPTSLVIYRGLTESDFLSDMPPSEKKTQIKKENEKNEKKRKKKK